MAPSQGGSKRLLMQLLYYGIANNPADRLAAHFRDPAKTAAGLDHMQVISGDLPRREALTLETKLINGQIPNYPASGPLNVSRTSLSKPKQEGAAQPLPPDQHKKIPRPCKK